MGALAEKARGTSILVEFSRQKLVHFAREPKEKIRFVKVLSSGYKFCSSSRVKAWVVSIRFISVNGHCHRPCVRHQTKSISITIRAWVVLNSIFLEPSLRITWPNGRPQQTRIGLSGHRVYVHKITVDINWIFCQILAIFKV